MQTTPPISRVVIPRARESTLDDLGRGLREAPDAWELQLSDKGVLVAKPTRESLLGLHLGRPRRRAQACGLVAELAGRAFGPTRDEQGVGRAIASRSVGTAPFKGRLLTVGEFRALAEVVEKERALLAPQASDFKTTAAPRPRPWEATRRPETQPQSAAGARPVPVSPDPRTPPRPTRQVLRQAHDPVPAIPKEGDLDGWRCLGWRLDDWIPTTPVGSRAAPSPQQARWSALAARLGDALEPAGAGDGKSAAAIPTPPPVPLACKHRLSLLRALTGQAAPAEGDAAAGARHARRLARLCGSFTPAEILPPSEQARARAMQPVLAGFDQDAWKGMDTAARLQALNTLALALATASGAGSTRVAVEADSTPDGPLARHDAASRGVHFNLADPHWEQPQSVLREVVRALAFERQDVLAAALGQGRIPEGDDGYALAMALWAGAAFTGLDDPALAERAGLQVPELVSLSPRLPHTRHAALFADAALDFTRSAAPSPGASKPQPG